MYNSRLIVLPPYSKLSPCVSRLSAFDLNGIVGSGTSFQYDSGSFAACGCFVQLYSDTSGSRPAPQPHRSRGIDPPFCLQVATHEKFSTFVDVWESFLGRLASCRNHTENPLGKHADESENRDGKQFHQGRNGLEQMKRKGNRSAAYFPYVLAPRCPQTKLQEHSADFHLIEFTWRGQFGRSVIARCPRLRTTFMPLNT